MDVFFAAFPLLLVVVLMAGPRPLPAQIALPLCAAVTWLLRLVWFDADPAGVHAAIISGLIAACTPILIVAGAVALFQVLDRCGAMLIWRRWLDGISPHPVARLMTVAWAFSFLIEGASGFGTPAALAAPILVACGLPAMRAAVICLVLNTVAVPFGAIGTPIWFGLGGLGLATDEVTRIGAHAALINILVAVPVVTLALCLVLPWRDVRASLSFVLLSVAACVIPAALIAGLGPEFPSLIGGGIGLIITVLAASRGWGLGAISADAPMQVATADTELTKPSGTQVLQAFLPLLLCVGILILTRLPFLPFNDWLKTNDTWVVSLGTLGQLGIGFGGSLTLSGILGSETAAQLQLLYVPGTIPFLLIALLTPLLLTHDSRVLGGALAATWTSLKHPIIALFGGLVLVRLLQQQDPSAPASTLLIGQTMASSLGAAWYAAAPFLGVLGAFFSGSATMSNLTFAPIQLAAATDLGLDQIRVLALQAVGAGAGNMVCVHNIVAVSAILGLQRAEGKIMVRTALPMLAYALLAVVAAWLLS
jgi:lactate permease